MSGQCAGRIVWAASEAIARFFGAWRMPSGEPVELWMFTGRE